MTAALFSDPIGDAQRAAIAACKPDSSTGWREVCRFWVDGTPRPGGSKRAALIPNRRGGFVTTVTGRPIVNVVEDGKHTAEWRQDVKALARAASHQGLVNTTFPIAEPVSVGFRFVMPRLKSHFRTGRHSGQLRDDSPHWHSVKPDILKLIRSTEDACTGILWVDDAQTVRLWPAPEKTYGDRPGCEIVVSVREAT